MGANGFKKTIFKRKIRPKIHFRPIYSTINYTIIFPPSLVVSLMKIYCVMVAIFSDRRFCRVNEQPESGCLHKQRPSAQTRAPKDRSHVQLTAYIVQTDTLFGAGHAQLMYTIKGKTGERASRG